MASKAVGLLTFNFGANLGGFDRAMKKAQKKLRKFGKSVERTGKSLSTNLTLPIVALGAVSLKTFADFEQSMLKVKAISGATEVEFEKLTESAKLLGSTTMFTASQVAELQLNLSKLGLTPQEINKSTESILQLAQATDSDLGQAATVAAKTMNAFGLEAEDMNMIADVMADSFSSTALDMTKFETAMASVAPVAKQAGASIQETSAILGVLVNNGVEASTAGTALRNIFLDLAKNGMTWGEAMDEINNASDPLAAAMDLFGKRGANVATILAQSGVEIQNLTDDFIDSAGEAKNMADIMDSGVAGSMRRMKSQLEGVAIEMGEHLVPVFKVFVEKIESAVKWFGTLSDEQKKNIVQWGLILAAIGPVLLIVGKAILAYGQLKTAIIDVNKFMMANPWALAAAAIAVVVTGVYKLVKAFSVQVDVQKELNDLNNDAQKSVAADLVNIDLLTGAIESETTSLEEKKKALDLLKSTYPGYYDEIDEATYSSDMLNKSTERLKESLINVAKVTAYQDKLTEIQRQIIDLEETGNVSTEVNVGTQIALGNLAPLVKIFDLATGKVTEFQEGVQENIDTKEISELTKLTDELTTKIAELNKTTEAPIILKVDHGDGDDNDPDDDGDDGDNGPSNRKVKQTELLSLSIKKVTENLADYNGEMKLAESLPLEEIFDTEPVNKYREIFGFFGSEIADFFGTTVWELEAGLESMVNKLGDNLAQGAESFEEFGKSALGVFRDIIGGLISQGIAAAVANALKDSFLPVWAIPVVAGAAAGLAKTAFNSLIPQFAEGGLVTGPTLGLIGEGAGTNAGNPEVVAPLDKLKSMIGTGSQNIVVEGKLAGNDIFLSNARTKFNRNRTV
jgi:phage-related minor tail protein